MRKIAILFFLFFFTFSGTTLSQWKYLTGYSGAVIATGGYGDTVFLSTSPGLSDSFKVYRSGDYGLTWGRVDSSLPVDFASAVQCFASIGSNLFAGMTSYGVRRSTDGGRSWKPTSSFYSLGDAYSLATRSDTLFVGYYNVSWSTNLGSTWTQSSFGHPASITTSVLPVGDKIFTASQGVSRSTDGGVNWTHVNSGLPSPDTYYLAALGSILFVNDYGHGVYRTTNSGGSWQVVNNGMIGDSLTVTSLAAASPYLFAGTDQDVYVSRDSGKSWQSTGFSNNVQFGTLAVIGPYLYAGSLYRHALADFFPAASVTKTITETGSYQFDDLSGTTGLTLNITSLTGAAQVMVSRFKDPPANPSFTGTPPVNLSQYRWVIDGSGGYSVTGEIRISLSAFSTGVVNPADVHIYKRSTSGTGAFTELPTTYDSGTNEIVAAINGFSEFVLGSSSDLLGVPRENSRVPARIALGQNYPNPFNPLTTIEFDLESRSFVTLKVFDLLGREVAALLNGEAMDGGAQRIQFSADGLPSGVYLYRIEVEAREGQAGAGAAAIRSIVRKMVLLK